MSSCVNLSVAESRAAVHRGRKWPKYNLWTK